MRGRVMALVINNDVWPDDVILAPRAESHRDVVIEHAQTCNHRHGMIRQAQTCPGCETLTKIYFIYLFIYLLVHIHRPQR